MCALPCSLGQWLKERLVQNVTCLFFFHIFQAVDFWLPLLQAPLPLVLQKQSNHAVRATACDCLADVGAKTFEQLPMDKRLLCVRDVPSLTSKRHHIDIMCVNPTSDRRAWCQYDVVFIQITLLLGLSSDEDSNVRASAIRALGVYVLYPCLREDVSFVGDVAHCKFYLHAWEISADLSNPAYILIDLIFSFAQNFCSMTIIEHFTAIFVQMEAHQQNLLSYTIKLMIHILIWIWGSSNKNFTYWNR